MRCIGAAAMLLAAACAYGDPGDPLPVPKGTPREHAVSAYNKGVTLMLERRFDEARDKFEQALALDARIAEAHNNLAFSLRMLGIHNFRRAMHHYERAIELDPKLAVAYLYRGALLSQVGDRKRADADLATLRALDPVLADKLDRHMRGELTSAERDGLASQFETIY